MKLLYKNLWMVGILCTSLFCLNSCMDEDDDIADTIMGHWFGDMGMDYNDGRYIEAAYVTEIQFTSDWKWGFNHGDGIQKDYYRNHTEYNRFHWEVHDRIVYLTYNSNPELDCAIVDYRLNYEYFSGYLVPYYNGVFYYEDEVRFSLQNYDRYWNSEDYYDYYVRESRSAADSTASDSIPGRSLRTFHKNTSDR